jgi:hypothetical protein
VRFSPIFRVFHSCLSPNISTFSDKSSVQGIHKVYAFFDWSSHKVYSRYTQQHIFQTTGFPYPRRTFPLSFLILRCHSVHTQNCLHSHVILWNRTCILSSLCIYSRPTRNSRGLVRLGNHDPRVLSNKMLLKDNRSLKWKCYRGNNGQKIRNDDRRTAQAQLVIGWDGGDNGDTSRIDIAVAARWNRAQATAQTVRADLGSLSSVALPSARLVGSYQILNLKERRGMFGTLSFDRAITLR